MERKNKNYKYVGVRFPWKCKVDRGVKNALIKVTVQFETEVNGQNEIVSNMDRSEVKLSISEKNIIISHIQNEILEQKNLTGSEFEGAPKLLKAFFSRLFLCQNHETHEVPTRAVFRPLV